MDETAARLMIRGDSLDPQEITELLGCQPHRAGRKGEKRILASGAQPTPEPTGVWSLQAARRVPGDLEGQITEILSALTEEPKTWLELSQRFQVYIFCGLFMKCSNEGLQLSSQIMHELGRRNVGLDFDIYDGSDADDQTTFDLEERLYSTLVPGQPQIKIAMLISRAFEDDSIPSDLRVNAALDQLISRTDIEAYGLIHNWRKSEIRRKVQ